MVVVFVAPFRTLNEERKGGKGWRDREREREREREGRESVRRIARGGSSCRGGKKTGVKIRKIWGGGGEGWKKDERGESQV